MFRQEHRLESRSKDRTEGLKKGRLDVLALPEFLATKAVAHPRRRLDHRRHGGPQRQIRDHRGARSHAKAALDALFKK